MNKWKTISGNNIQMKSYNFIYNLFIYFKYLVINILILKVNI